MITVPYICQNSKYSKHRCTFCYTGFQTQELNQTEPRDQALQKGTTSPAQGHLTAPRKSWKLMVEFFMALNTNIGSWIRNLERRDMMLLASMAGKIFGFAGTYARQKQASLAPIQTGWKRWVEMHSNKDIMTPRIGWTSNLQISGSIETNTVEKAVFWNIGPHGYKGSKEAQQQIFELGPPIICLQDVRIPKRRKNSVKRELQRIFPHCWIYITTAQSQRTNNKDRPYVFSVLTVLHLAFLPKFTQVRR